MNVFRSLNNLFASILDIYLNAIIKVILTLCNWQQFKAVYIHL